MLTALPFLFMVITVMAPIVIVYVASTIVAAVIIMASATIAASTVIAMRMALHNAWRLLHLAWAARRHAWLFYIKMAACNRTRIHGYVVG